MPTQGSGRGSTRAGGLMVACGGSDPAWWAAVCDNPDCHLRFPRRDTYGGARADTQGHRCTDDPRGPRPEGE